jgi:prevent-host-death family protein
MTIMTISEFFVGSLAMSTQTWTVAEAKAKLSELLEKAKSEGPQKITKHGRTTAVVVAAEEWERKAERKGNLAEFLAASPLRRLGVKPRKLVVRLRRAEL